MLIEVKPILYALIIVFLLLLKGTKFLHKERIDKLLYLKFNILAKLIFNLEKYGLLNLYHSIKL